MPETEPAAGSASAATRRVPSGGLPSWLLLVAIAAGALALAFAHLPPIFKKLGLFAVAYGSLVGLIGAWLAQFAPVLRRRPWVATAVVCLFALAGQVGVALESYRMQRFDEQVRERADPQQQLARRLLESANEPADAKSKSTLDEFRRSREGPGSSFAEYLRFRVSDIGIRSKWAAVLFWAVEIGLGSLAAGWLFRRRMPTAAGESPTSGPAFDAGIGPAKLDE
jgi:hypothetical protein